MAKRASTRSQGKRVRKDDVSDDEKRDTDFKDDGSEQEELRSPPRKRQRATAKTTKAPARKKQAPGKQGRVVRLADIPTKIITEILSNLVPIDLIYLSRTNKFFRNLLMSQSSVGIWHEAMEKIPGLPECPPGMSEPRYLAFVFLKTCTSCGKGGKVELDEGLRVRLCGPCRKSCLVVWNTLPPGIMPLIPFSGRIAPAPRRSHAYSLREDVPGLVAELESIKRLNDPEAHKAWVEKKWELKRERQEHTQQLRDFLHVVNLFEEAERENTKEERQDEIEHRLKECGWTAEEMDFEYPGCTDKRAWLDLVAQPKPLTERGWTTLKPKLIALLESNREKRVEAGRRTRKQGRKDRLAELFNFIKLKGIIKVEVSSPNGDSTAPTTVSYDPPFPNLPHMLDLPVVLGLYETDRPVADMEAEFEERRKEIQNYITEWTNRVQAHFVNLARQGPKLTKPILQSTSRNKKSDPFAKLSDDAKRLLRADCFFISTSWLESGRALSYGSVLKSKGLIGADTSLAAPSPKQPPTLDGIEWYAEANQAAREILRSLGKPNASYFEMTDKAIYACARCHDTGAKTWQEIVRHYVETKQQHAKVQEQLSSSKKIRYNNVHDPKLLAKQPLVRYSSAKPTDDSEQFECKVCAERLIVEGVLTSEEKILKHLLDVHGIAKPQPDEDYGPQITDEYDDFDEYDGYDSCGPRYYDSEEAYLFGVSDDDYSLAGGCGYARRRMAGYGGFGRRRSRHHYKRPRCAYDPNFNEDDWM